MLSQNLRDLCRDRELVTPELHPSNDYYGNAGILKRFIGMPEDNPTHCIIEHGPFFPTLHWDVDLNSPLPVFLRVNRAACRAIAPKTDKLVYAIGPMIAYADCHLNADALLAEKKRLGKNLLIFPPHSTHHIRVEFDRPWLIRHVHAMSKAYDSVTVCLYWKDIASEPLYRAEGFECATAGHMYDPLFLNRLKTLLTIADGVISYSWCSAIGYSVWMGKPTMAMPARGEFYPAPPEVIERDTVGGLRNLDNSAYKSKIFELFSDLSEVTEAKRQAIDLMWGLSDIKSREELTDIFTAARDLHVVRSTLGLAAFPDALRQGRFYRQIGKPKMALLVIEQALRMARSSPELLLEASLAQADCGQIRQAREYSGAFLKEFPRLSNNGRSLYMSGKNLIVTPEQLHASYKIEMENSSSGVSAPIPLPKAVMRREVLESTPKEPEWIGIHFPAPLGRAFKNEGIATSPRYLNLGCGNRFHPRWVNIDFTTSHPMVVAHDLKRGIPFEDLSFDAVYHSHLLEHFSKLLAPRFLQECHRVLKIGGILRVVVPDLEQIVRWYLRLLEQSLQGDGEAQSRYEWIMLEMFDQMVRNHSGGEMLEYWRQNPMAAESFVVERMGAEVLGVLYNLRRSPMNSREKIPQCLGNAEQIGRFRLSGEIHQWMYDRYSLRRLLTQAGFTNVKVRRAGESAIPGFNDFHLDLQPDGSVRKPDSLFMEAHK